MIDWVTCRLPCLLPAPIAGGWTVKLNRDGSERLRTPHRLSVEGSHSSTLTIRAPSTTELEISGNLTKWLQGHNLYGSDDMQSLLWAALQRLEPHLGGSLASIGLGSKSSLANGIVTRADLTFMMMLDSRGDVLSWIRSAESTGSAGRRGRGVLRGDTLVFGDAKGRSFTRWQIVIYSKGQEIEAHCLPPFMMNDSEVRRWTDKTLRIEVRAGRLELEKIGLRAVGAWAPATSFAVWSDKLKTLTFSDAAKSDTVDLVKLPSKLRGTFAQWKLGADLRQSMSKATFYKHRADLIRLTGIDISIPPPAEPTSTVVPIKRTLEAQPIGRPIWADRIDQKLRESGAIVFGDAA